MNRFLATFPLSVQLSSLKMESLKILTERLSRREENCAQSVYRTKRFPNLQAQPQKLGREIE